MFLQKKKPTPLDYIVALDLNRNEISLSKSILSIGCNVRFASDNQYITMKDSGFDDILFLFEKCLPNGYCIENQPSCERRIFKKNTVVHIDLSHTQTPQGYGIDLEKTLLIKITKKEIENQIKNK